MNLGYIRVSTEEQGKSGLSLAAQKEGIKGYTIAFKIPLDDIHIDVYSGKTMDRPEFNKIRELIVQEDVENFVVYRLDRMARNTAGALEFSELLKTHGVVLHSVTERVDTSTPQGKMFFTIMTAFAEMERELISERITEALAIRKSNGLWSARIPKDHKLVEGRLVSIDTPYTRKLYRGLDMFLAGTGSLSVCECARRVGITQCQLQRAVERYEWEHGDIIWRRRRRSRKASRVF